MYLRVVYTYIILKQNYIVNKIYSVPLRIQLILNYSNLSANALKGNIL